MTSLKDRYCTTGLQFACYLMDEITLRVFTEASVLVTGNVGYITTKDQIGASVMRKMTFLVRGKLFLLMDHMHSLVTVGSEAVHRSRSFSSLREQCMNSARTRNFYHL